ncbi:MAG: PrsW family intramembrane metalloprotease [Caldilineaceae bacterium]
MLLAFLIILTATVIPTYLYVRFFYWADRYEREPRWLILAAFLWGAVPSVILSLLGEMLLSIPTQNATLIGDALSAPIVEEISKGFALLLIFWFMRSEFDGVLDGLTYGSMIGFGFAMTENFLYFIGAYGQGGYRNLTLIFFLRTVLFGLNHAFYTGFSGIGLGLARESRSAFARIFWPLVGLSFAIAAHSLHNFGANIAERNGLGLVLSLSVAVLGFAFILGTILLSWQYERNFIRKELAEEIGVTLTAQEYSLLTQHWRNPVRPAKSESATMQRLQLCVELALRKHRLHRLGELAEPALPQEIAQIRAELALS